MKNASQRIDPLADGVYEYLRERFGRDDPRSSGYRSLRSFEFEAAVIRKLVRRYDGRLLDLACGHGLITAALVAEQRPVFGVDYNENAVCSATRRRLSAVRGDVFSIPFKEGSFDVVLSAEFMQQYNSEQAKILMGEMVRVTRPGGVLVLIWRQGASLVRRLVTINLGIVDRARGRPELALFDHGFETVCGWARGHQLQLVDSLSLSPLLGLAVRNAESWASRVFGTSYVAVFRRHK
jgi:SAM-dependent methyltransferase